MSGFGSNATNAPAFGIGSAGFDRAAPVFDRVDDASEPFGRVESTQQCFARNGKAATWSKWTPPKPPSRSLFQSSPSVFYSSAGGSKPYTPLFGDPVPQQSGSLFGSSRSSRANQTTGGFSFGRSAAPTTSSNSIFGGDVDSNGVFGTGRSGSAFGFGSSTAKPPLAPSSNPFATPTSNPFTKATTNPFATKPANVFTGSTTEDKTFGGINEFSFGGSTTTQFGSSTKNLFAVKNVPANPFAMKPSSTVNPFSAKVAPHSTVNPFATKPSSTANPFAAKVAPSSTVNPFAAKVAPNAALSSFPLPTPSASSTDSFAKPGSAWSTTASGMSFRSASMKFKSGLRTPSTPKASPWNLGTQQLKSVEQTQPEPFPHFDWSCKETTQSSAECSLNVSPSEAASSSPSTTASSSVISTAATSTALVASPDRNPYGSGSFGAGLLEQKVKTAIANPPSSTELKMFGARTSSVSSSSVPHLQSPSARFAARLGLARQPLQALPMRPVQPRFPSCKRPMVPSPVRAKLPQADVFRFSSSFSRLAVSKKSSRIRVEPSTMPMNAPTRSSRKANSDDADDEEAQTPVVSDVKSDDASSSHSKGAKVGDHDDEGSPSPACPVLLNEEYFTEPAVSDMQQLTDEELASVENFVIGRRRYGKISFVGATDVRGLQLDNLVTFSDGKVVVYPGDDAKPEVGSAFNKPAVVNLHGISAEVNESHEDFLKRLETHTQALGATFLGYDENSQAGNGVWSFRVEHF
ncbi:hypothetical protein PRIC1_001608 [Phytophthora ramorum]